MCSALCPRLSEADWCLQSNAVPDLCLQVVSRTKSEETATADGGLAAGAGAYHEQQAADLNKAKADLSVRREDLERQQDKVEVLEHEQQSLTQKVCAGRRAAAMGSCQSPRSLDLNSPRLSLPRHSRATPELPEATGRAPPRVTALLPPLDRWM